MYCKHCGHEINENAIICPGCGVATDNYYGKAPVAASTATVNNNNNTDQKFNGLALAGMICAIVGLAGGDYIVLLPSIAGLILSIIGIVKAKEYKSGYGFALTGIIVGAIGLFIWSIFWLILGSVWVDIIFNW